MKTYITLIIICALFFLIGYSNKESITICEKKGGILVQGINKFVCLDVKEIK